MRVARLLLRILVLVFATVLIPTCLAQLPPVNGTTATPIPGAGHDYLGGVAETVNPTNGAISIRIPVIVPPARGITLPFSFAYDSSGANYVAHPLNSAGFLAWFTTGADSAVPAKGFSQTGWSNSIPMVSDNLIHWTTTNTLAPQGAAPLVGTIQCYAMVNFVYQDAHGNRHNLGLTNYSDPGGTGPCTINSQDWPRGFNGEIVTQGGEGTLLATLPADWGSTLAGNVSITDGDGTGFGSLGGTTNRLWPAGGASDRNGNYMSINTASYPAFNYVDTLERTVLQDTGFAVTPETLTVSGLSAPYTLNWRTLATPTFTTGTTVISGTVCGSLSHYAWNSTNDHAVSSITLPNGKSFSFTYDPVYGLVNKMSYPTGGYVRYVWGLNPRAAEGHYDTTNGQSYYWCDMSYDVPAVVDRYVSFDGTTEVLHQHFVYTTTWPAGSTTWTTKQTTVTNYDLVRNTNSQTIYTYSPIVDNWQPNAETGPQPQIPVESSVAYYDTNGVLLETVAKGWLNERLLGSQSTTFANGQASKTTWSYNTSELEIEHDYYDFPTASSFLRATVTSYATSTNMAAYHVIDKPASVIVYSDAAKTNRVAETDYTYDSPAGTVTSGIVQHSGGCNCGNLTAQAQWLNTSGSNLTTNFTNDDTGQRLFMTDPRGNITNYSYADNYSSGTPPGPTNAYLTQITYPNTGVAQVEKFAYAYASGEVTSSTDKNNLVTTDKYVDNLARLTETDFPDGGVTTIAYNDAAYNPSTPSPSVTISKKIDTSGRLLKTVNAMDGIGHRVQTELCEDGSACTQPIKTDTTYDGLGRVWKQSNPHRSGSLSTDGTTTYFYDALGRPCLVVPSDGTLPAGNVCPATSPANDVFTTYSGNCTTVTDEAGKSRKSCSDGLGRLTQVFEDPANRNYETDYKYDALDNLLCAAQKGTNSGTFSNCASTPASWRLRSFNYDSLSRLTSATNPESGTTTYTYDNNGNVLTKTSPAPNQTGTATVTTCFGNWNGTSCDGTGYDALNRLKLKTYSDGTTPYAQYTWDANPPGGPIPNVNNIGRLATTWSPNYTGSKYNYDPMGRVANSLDCTDPSCNWNSDFSYTYDLLGDLTTYTNKMAQWTNPPVSSITFNQSFDSAGRVTQLTSSLVDGQHPSPLATVDSSVGYWPTGAVRKVSLGNGLYETAAYNKRLQPCRMNVNSTGAYVLTQCTDSLPGNNVLDFTYGFNSGTSDNGNVASWSAVGQQSFNRTYTYDSLNRIATLADSNTGQSCRGLSWTIDPWGNRTDQTVSAGTCNTFHQAVDANNRLLGAPYQYDAAGNMTHDATHSYTYDAENRIIQVDGGTTASYAYDPTGRRVQKTMSVTTTSYVYNLAGNVLFETQASSWVTTYLYFAGALHAQYKNSVTSFIHSDHLGSTRLVTAMNQSVSDNLDYLPCGEQITGDTSATHKFTGKERDSESGLDNFGARYYSSPMGRFTSVDPIWVKIDRLLDPQRLNLYAYARNNPLAFLDPDGEDVTIGKCSIGTAQDCFNQLEAGLKNEDRGHVHLVTGDGDNGCAKGGSCVMVDADYKSDSKNFQVLQQLSNDHSGNATIDVVKPNDKVTVLNIKYENYKTGEKKFATAQFEMGDPEKGTGQWGYTLFPFYPGQPGPWSPDKSAHAIATTISDSLAATIHHELRHIFLGDFGRTATKATHGQIGVGKETRAAEREAKRNENQN